MPPGRARARTSMCRLQLRGPMGLAELSESLLSLCGRGVEVNGHQVLGVVVTVVVGPGGGGWYVGGSEGVVCVVVGLVCVVVGVVFVVVGVVGGGLG